MKLLISFFLLIIAITAHGQSDAILGLVKITSSGLKEKQNVSCDGEASSLIVGDWIIPVSENTTVKRIKSNQVTFSLQKGTAVTSVGDSQLRKAWFILRFNSRKSAKDFVDAFTKASI